MVFTDAPAGDNPPAAPYTRAPRTRFDRPCRTPLVDPRIHIRSADIPDRRPEKQCGLRGAAAFRNVSMKLFGTPAEPFCERGLHPCLRRMYDAFVPEPFILGLGSHTHAMQLVAARTPSPLTFAGSTDDPERIRGARFWRNAGLAARIAGRR